MVVDKHSIEILKGSWVRCWDEHGSVGRAINGFPGDPQGLPGMITVDLGAGCFEYVPANRLEVIKRGVLP